MRMWQFKCIVGWIHIKMLKFLNVDFSLAQKIHILEPRLIELSMIPLATHPWGLLEIKCPHSVKRKTPLQAAKEAKTFMCREENGLLYNEIHQYYYQVQGQLGITGAKWCDFVVYTTQGISIQRINCVQVSGKVKPNYWVNFIIVIFCLSTSIFKSLISYI